jgi:hypothetical protein
MMDIKRENCVAETFDTQKIQWTGLGDLRSEINAMNTIKRTLLEIERKIPCVLKHIHWKTKRNGWIKQLKKSRCLPELARQMLELASSIKLVCFRKVWLASLRDHQAYGQYEQEKENALWIGYPLQNNSVTVQMYWEVETRTGGALRLSALAMQLQILHASLNWNEFKVSIIISL